MRAGWEGRVTRFRCPARIEFLRFYRSFRANSAFETRKDTAFTISAAASSAALNVPPDKPAPAILSAPFGTCELRANAALFCLYS